MKRAIYIAGVLLVLGVTVMIVESQPADYGIELLIYDKDHWMDGLTSGQLKQYIADRKITQEEYDNRTRRGDVIEVRPWPTMEKMDPNRWGGHAFRVVVVKGIRYNDAIQYMDRLPTGRRRFRILNTKTTEVDVIDNPTNLLIVQN